MKRSLMKTGIAISCLITMAGCSETVKQFNDPPGLTPMGQGLRPRVVSPTLAQYQPPRQKGFQTIWSKDRKEFFAEPRAKRVGDVLTVSINIADEASLDNASDRSRNGSRNFGLGFGFDLFGFREGGDSDVDIDAESESEGRGAINRKEEINLQVAAVVTQLLPNGNMVISGSQEVRVNYEVRVLEVEGIVRPRDIDASNVITYDKIAEARVSYGGRGRISEVQQPAWGQRIYDRVVPF